jgi:hypothetical protein
MKVPSDFNWKVYLDLNPPLRKAGLSTERQAIYHYYHYGQKQNRKYKIDKIKLTDSKINQSDIQNAVSYIIYDNLEFLKKTLDNDVNKNKLYEVIFGFKKNSETNLNEILELQNKFKNLHCYIINDEVNDVYFYLHTLSLYNNKIFDFGSTLEINNQTIFDFNLIQSTKKINLGVLTSTWKRKSLTTNYCQHIDYLKNKFSNLINLTSVIVDSDLINKDSSLEFNHLYFDYQNQPLSNKFNFGMSQFKSISLDYVMILGSDNFCDDILFLEYIKIMRNNFDLIGVLNSYIYDVKTSIMYRYLGYPKDNPRYNETLGAGRVLSKRLLENLNYNPWKDGLSKGLDGSMWQKLSHYNFFEYKINTVQINGLMLGVKTDTFITDVNKMKNKIKTDKSILNRISYLSHYI